MNQRPNFRALADTLSFYGLRLALIVGALFAQLVLAGCAGSKVATTSTQVVVTDTASLRQVQRLVAVSVPGDSATLTTRLSYDEKTGRFRPVTLFTHAGHLRLAYSVDAAGQVHLNAYTLPWLASVPVFDTERTRTTTKATDTRSVLVKAKPLGKFAWTCILFTVGFVVLVALRLYARFVSPIRFLKWL